MGIITFSVNMGARLVHVDRVSKSQIFVESSSTFLIFFDNDAYAFTSTRRNFFHDLARA